MKKLILFKNFALICMSVLIWGCNSLSEVKTSPQAYLFVRDRAGQIMTQIDPSILKLIKTDLIVKNRQDDIQKLANTYDPNNGAMFPNVNISSSERARAASSSYAIGIKTTGEAPYATETYRPYTGGIVGTTGQSKRLESFLIFVVDPNTYSTISSNDPRYSFAYGAITYQAHVSGIGWQSVRYSSTDSQNSATVAGTIEKSEQIEAIKIWVDPNFGTNVFYRAHVAGTGWLPWVSNGQQAGTTGEARRLEAFQFQLLIY